MHIRREPLLPKEKKTLISGRFWATATKTDINSIHNIQIFTTPTNQPLTLHLVFFAAITVTMTDSYQSELLSIAILPLWGPVEPWL